LRHALLAPGRVHLVGLVSRGGVHSSLDHLCALLALAGEGEAEVIVHAITDGRDTGPREAPETLRELEALTGARVADLIGRYYAMDRDKRWDRVQKAYDLLVHARGDHRAASAAEAVEAAYARGETDEFIAPTLVGEAIPIAPGDRVVTFNFRPDRMRELVSALADPAFADIDRGGAEPVRDLSTMTEYEEGWPYPVAFPPERLELTLGSVIAATGARQLHVAETEKYPHVTYFFNGGEERPYAGESRRLVPSPRDVATYDEKPEMSARAAADAFCEAWAAERPRFAIINFANPDMVGHTGVIGAARAAVEAVDTCLGDVIAAVHGAGGVAIVTADHGNAEEMLTPAGEPQTAHSLNPVPLIVTTGAVALAAEGILADVAPTALELLGVEQPSAMRGSSLLRRLDS
ncbi:MAG TPA: 2,3-bisphosphoglycerate-independent phosphoglycerate mutase, partial [Solirubrobacteraceae bacterium]|nr:2,3-bisphosphoglycerate-independent phosphoglycerate mutase [Solirubrobacteraceae bacterium]